MYVGDDADDVAAELAARPSKTEYAAGAIGAYAALTSKGLVRIVGAGIAAWVGYKAYKSRDVMPL